MILKSLVYFFLLIPFPLGFSQPCINDTYAADVLQSIERMVDTVKGEQGHSRLIESTCGKRVYLRGTYRLILSPDPSDVRGVTGSALQNNPNRDEKCWQAALVDVEILSWPAASGILREYKKKYPELWMDVDLGPTKWLSCGESRYDNLDSTLTMLHEVNHGLQSRDGCLYFAAESRYVCFKLGKQMPARDIAKVESWPEDKQAVTEGYRDLQRVYFEQKFVPGALSLFDELNAYTITARGMIMLLKTHGPSGIYKENGNRSAIFLSAFLVYTANYMQKLKENYPALYVKFMSVKENRENLGALLSTAEVTMEDYIQALAGIGKTLTFSELDLFERYKKQKPAMGLF